MGNGRTFGGDAADSTPFIKKAPSLGHVKIERGSGGLVIRHPCKGTSHTDPEDIQFTTIENAVYMGMKNDVSFILFYVMNIY